MTINFDNALGVHPQMLELRGKRMELLADNLANADTPGFRARDVDFQSVLEGVQGENPAVRLQSTDPGHFQPPGGMNAATTGYRIPNQPSLDGNTVETQIEQARYAENAIQYQVSMQFVSGKLKAMVSAIKGE